MILHDRKSGTANEFEGYGTDSEEAMVAREALKI